MKDIAIAKPAAAVLVAMFTCVLVVAAIAGRPSVPQQVPSPKDVVAPTIYASLDPAGRGSSFQLAAVLKIRPGFHINAREKSEDYLIATDLRAEAPAGFQLGEVSYPKGALHTFTFSKKPLNVYESTVVLRVPVTLLANAPLGTQHLPFKLRYQACSTEVCLPPVTLSLDAAINVAGSSADSKPAHPEVFAGK